MHAVLIQARCQKCGTQNRMVISEKNSAAPKCGKCCGELFDVFAVIKGYVYILSNPGMPKLLKIGQTTGSIKRRVDQLSAPTSVPKPFVIEAYFVSQSPLSDEKKLHSALEPHRLAGREFFMMPLTEALIRAAETLERRPQYVRRDHGEFKEP